MYPVETFAAKSAATWDEHEGAAQVAFALSDGFGRYRVRDREGIWVGDRVSHAGRI